jgi:hypothetical protein
MYSQVAELRLRAAPTGSQTWHEVRQSIGPLLSLKTAKYIRLKQSVQKSNQLPARASSATVAEGRPQHINGQPEEQNHEMHNVPTTESHRHPEEVTTHHDEAWEDAEGLQPAGLLSKKAHSGRFSLQNILSVPDVLAPHSNTLAQFSTVEGIDKGDDPIACNILTFPVALGLLDKYVYTHSIKVLTDHS